MKHDLDYGDLDDEGPDTIMREVSEMTPTLHEIPLGSRQEAGWEGLDDDPIEEHPDEPYWVIDRENPVTLSAAAKTDVVTTLNKILDRLYDLQTDIENVLMSIDRGG